MNSLTFLFAVAIGLAGSMAAVAFADDANAFVGIGMTFERLPDGTIRVTGLLDGGPAQKAGLLVGDVVASIDGADVRQISNDDIPKHVTGPAGTDVKLAIASSGQTRQLSVRRAVVPKPVIQPPMQPSGPGNLPGGAAPPVAPPRSAPPGDAPNLPQNPNEKNLQNPAGVTRFALRSITDPAVGNIVAAQAMIPQTWQGNGQIVWMHNYTMMTWLNLWARDPQTGLTVMWLPIQSFIFSPNPPVAMQAGANYMGRVWMQPIADPAQFVQWFWGQSLPQLKNARVVGQQNYQGPTQLLLNQMPNNGRKSGQTVRIRYEFAAQDGSPWEADVMFSLTYNDLGQAVYWDALNATAAMGPKGSLDRYGAVIQAMIGSTQFTPQWLATRQVCQQIFRQGLQQEMQDTAAFSQKLAAYREQIQQTSQQIFENNLRSMDDRNQAFRETLGGVENYRDPYNPSPVYLPAGYKEYWSNAKGEYVLSEQWGFNPNAGDTTEWRKMDRIDPMGK